MRRLLVFLLAAGGLGLCLADEKPASEEEARLARAVGFLKQENVRGPQRGLAMLGRLALPEAEKLLLEHIDKLERGELPHALWLDLFEAAEQRQTPKLKARLQAYRQAAGAAADPLRAWRECLEGGDADNGREIFYRAPEAGCARCHAVGGEGGTIGPELGGLGLRTDRIYILESILLPNSSTVMGYGHYLFTLTDGEVFSGLLFLENQDHLTIISLVDGSRRRVRSDAVEKREPLPSAMPPIFGQALTRRQLRDLVEFITLSEPPSATPATPE